MKNGLTQKHAKKGAHGTLYHYSKSKNGLTNGLTPIFHPVLLTHRSPDLLQQGDSIMNSVEEWRHFVMVEKRAFCVIVLM